MKIVVVINFCSFFLSSLILNAWRYKSGDFLDMKSRRLANLCPNFRRRRYKLCNLLAPFIIIFLSQNSMLSFCVLVCRIFVYCVTNTSLSQFLINYIESFPVIWVPKSWLPFCSSRSIFIFSILSIYAINLMKWTTKFSWAISVDLCVINHICFRKHFDNIRLQQNSLNCRWRNQ